MKKRIVVVVLVALALGAFAGCFPGSQPTKEEPAGFFMGVWHGWIAPLSLIVGFFNPHIRIYETNNIGWWYDLGYYIAIIAGFGGIAFSRGRKRKKSQ